MAPKQATSPTVFIKFHGIDKVVPFQETFDTCRILAKYVPESNGYAIEGDIHGRKFALLTKRRQRKIFRSLDTVVNLLRELNVLQFTVIT